MALSVDKKCFVVNGTKDPVTWRDSFGRFCLSLAGVFLVVSFEEAPRTARAGENEDVKGLLQLENDMARAWVQRDTQTLDQILADDYTLTGTADALIGKREYIAGLDNSEFETD